MAGEDELKVFIIGSPEEASGWGVFELPILVDLDLLLDLFDVFGAVQRIEDLLNQFLLIAVEGRWDAIIGMNVPPVADILTSRMIRRQTHFLSLFIIQTFIKLHRQRI